MGVPSVAPRVELPDGYKCSSSAVSIDGKYRATIT